MNTSLASALEGVFGSRPKPEAIMFAPETEIAPVTLAASRVIIIPATFTIDDHGFSYYLKTNQVDHAAEIVNIIEEQADGQPINKQMREFFFPSERAYDHAQTIWQALTGCAKLGKLEKWQSWEKFR